MARPWYSYDQVAEAYDGLAAPLLFTGPAQDLVTLLHLPAGGQILDVGVGTGAVTRAALRSLGAGGSVVGLDLSEGMLQRARRRGLPHAVCGSARDLPFREGAFDGILAGFVLNHINSYSAALYEMVRVLRPQRMVGVSAWGTAQNEFREFWRSLADAAVGNAVLGRAIAESIPREEWFSDPAHLRSAVEEVGLECVEVEERVYYNTMTISQLLAIREVSMPARFLRTALGAEAWVKFRENTENAFRARFREPLVDVTRALLCTGKKG